MKRMKKTAHKPPTLCAPMTKKKNKKKKTLKIKSKQAKHNCQFLFNFSHKK